MLECDQRDSTGVKMFVLPIDGLGLILTSAYGPRSIPEVM